MKEGNGSRKRSSLEFPVNEHFSILLVEDDNVCLKAVEQMLKKYGNYSVTTAVNGRIALQLLKEAKANGRKGFDLVLTDLILPEVSGFDLIQEVVAAKGDAVDVPIVVMSSQDSRESVLQAFEAGAADYLIKPIRKNEVSTLWQHIWRNNRFKAAQPGIAAQHSTPPSPDHISVLNDDSGASTTAEQEQSTYQSSGEFPHANAQESMLRAAPATADKPAALAQQQQQQQAATPKTSMPGNSSGTSPKPPAQMQGAAVAAVHLDITTHNVELLQTKVRDAAALGTSRDCIVRDSDGIGYEQGTSDMPPPGTLTMSAAHPAAAQQAHSRQHTAAYSWGSSPQQPLAYEKANDATEGAAHGQPVAFAKLQPTRPHASSHTRGQHQELPPGLRELAVLGQQREHMQQPQHAGQDQPHAEQANMLNRSGRSAFTAVTVFLPRPQESNPAAAVPGVLLPSLPTPLQISPLSSVGACREDMGAGAAQGANAHKAQVAHQQEGQADGRSAAAGQAQNSDVALRGAIPLASHASSSPHMAQPAPGHVYLPESVIQLICALSGRAPMPDARCTAGAPSGMARASSNGAVPVVSSGSAAGLEANGHLSKSAHRQAAVAKYLIKRKNRTFHKKVRYESRKRLAESRPRVRGQFVKQGGDAKAAVMCEVPSSDPMDTYRHSDTSVGMEHDTPGAQAASAGPSSARAAAERHEGDDYQRDDMSEDEP